MAFRTLTTANSVFALTAPDVFGALPQLIQGFSTDDSFSVANFATAVAEMGVDAAASFGFTPALKLLTVVLQATSLSRAIFERIQGVQEATREVVELGATIILPGTQEGWVFTTGVITEAPKLPAGKKTAQPTTWVITWQDIQPAATA